MSEYEEGCMSGCVGPGGFTKGPCTGHSSFSIGEIMFQRKQEAEKKREDRERHELAAQRDG